jgi:hypothetical protein
MESFSNNPTISPIKAGSAPKRAKKTTAKSATGEAKVEAKIEAEIEAEVEAKDVEYGAITVKKEPTDNLNFEDYMLHFMKTDPKASKSAVQAVGDAYDVDTPVIKEE